MDHPPFPKLERTSFCKLKFKHLKTGAAAVRHVFGRRRAPTDRQHAAGHAHVYPKRAGQRGAESECLHAAAGLCLRHAAGYVGMYRCLYIE